MQQVPRVIIDTDPGVDDALALFVAFSHFTIEGMHSVGNLQKKCH
jgi:inosine-uridine nucleoside N-ribohydrolase